MWKWMFVLLLFAAHLNLTAIVPLQSGQAPPPWWVGGMLIWPFAVDTPTLLPKGDLLNTVTPLLGVTSAIIFLMAAAALLRKLVPSSWFRGLVIVGAALSIVLQVIWFSAWAVLPLLVDAVLLWAVFRQQASVENLRLQTVQKPSM